MKTIWKWTLVAGRNEISMPMGAKVLDVQVQGEDPQLWALVEKPGPENLYVAAVKERRFFDVYGTGHDIEEPPGKYIATFQLPKFGLVWHVFERSA